MIKRTNGILAGGGILGGLGLSQVPADIAAKLVAMGPNVCPADTAALYRHFQPSPPYPGVKVTRDLSYGPDAREIMDVFTAEKGGGNRTVLIFVSGGAGNKIEPVPHGRCLLRQHHAVGHEEQHGGGERAAPHRSAPRRVEPEPAKDISTVIQWVHKNIAQYKGNPNRVFIWSHSAGQSSGGDLPGTSGAVWAGWDRSQRRDPDVARGVQYRSDQRGRRWRRRTSGRSARTGGAPAAGAGGQCPSGSPFGGGAQGQRRAGWSRRQAVMAGGPGSRRTGPAAEAAGAARWTPRFKSNARLCRVCATAKIAFFLAICRA